MNDAKDAFDEPDTGTIRELDLVMIYVEQIIREYDGGSVRSLACATYEGGKMLGFRGNACAWTSILRAELRDARGRNLRVVA